MMDTGEARPSGSDSALSGMKEICGYTGKTDKTVVKYIEEEGFPAIKIGGVWESDKERIDTWRLARIDSRTKGNMINRAEAG